MKNKVQYHILLNIMWYSFLLLILALIIQIILSSVFAAVPDASICMGCLDISEIIWGESGRLTIYYSDMIRIGSFVLLLIPYTVALTHVINKIVAKPLLELTKEVSHIDYDHLEERLTVPANYEFLQLETAFNELLEKLEKTTKDRNKAENEKDLLISGMAHDLKTPITTIRGYSQALSDSVLQNDSQKKEYIDAINKKAMQLDGLITLLFDYVRLGTSQYSLKFEKVDLVELVKENIGLYYTEFEEGGIDFLFDLPEGKIVIDADPGQLNRVFSNIYSNALQYNHKGDTVNTRILLDDKITIVIEDTGDAIPEKIADNIFNPFVMGDYSRKTGMGNGLGLCIASKIISLHQGRLFLKNGVKSKYTKSFIIELCAG